MSELGGFGLSPLGEGTSVGDGAGHDASHRGGNLEDVGDGRRINELVLLVIGQLRHLDLMLDGHGLIIHIQEPSSARGQPRSPCHGRLST